MNSLLGYFVQGQSLGNAEIQALLNHLQKVQPTTVSVMDNYALCVQIQNLLPNCIVVTRDSTFEPTPDYSNAALAKYLQALPDKRIVQMVNCEAGFNAERVAMWVRFMQVADGLGYRLCIGNTSSGSIKSGQSNDPNDWITTGAPLLKALAQTSAHFLGVHNYTPDFLWVVTNGGWGDPEHAPDKMDLALPQWHLCREAQGIIKAAKALSIPELIERRPFMIVTEGFIDEMADVRSNPDYPYKWLKSNRWRDCIPAWANWYKGVSAEDVLANQVIWALDTLYKPLGFVLGIHFFTWADASGQWAGDRVDNALTFQQRMEAYAASTSPASTTQPPTSTDNSAAIKALIVKIENDMAGINGAVDSLHINLEHLKALLK